VPNIITIIITNNNNNNYNNTNVSGDIEKMTLETPVGVVLDTHIITITITIEVPSSNPRMDLDTKSGSNTKSSISGSSISSSGSSNNNNSKCYEFVVLPDHNIVTSRKYKHNNKAKNKRKRFKDWEESSIISSSQALGEVSCFNG